MPRTEATFAALYSVLKSELKTRSLTYRSISEALGMTANGVKLRFAHRNLSIKQLIVIAKLLGMTLTDLMQKVEKPAATKLTLTQEKALTQNTRLLLVLERILDGWSMADIIATYELTEAECLKYLLMLDRLEMIDLMPHNIINTRIRLNSEWVPNGPLHRLLRERLKDYFNSPFDAEFEHSYFARAYLTPAAILVLQDDMRQLKSHFEALHEECKLAPPSERRRIVLVAAEREWELPDHRAWRRKLPEAAAGRPQKDRSRRRSET